MRAAYLLTALCAGNLASTTTSGNTDVYIPDGNEGEAGSLTSRSIERRNLITDILKDITNSLAKVGDALTCVACEVGVQSNTCEALTHSYCFRRRQYSQHSKKPQPWVTIYFSEYLSFSAKRQVYLLVERLDF